MKANFEQPRSTILVIILAATLSIAPLSTTPASADFGDPCKKYKKGSKKWKKCKRRTSLFPKPVASSTDDERFMAGYWLAKHGYYQEAIDVLSKIDKSDDPRILNYIGYATRKLGNIDQALVFYRKAISLDPDYVMSRAYMGEAFLAKGDRHAALTQLREIAQRCGTSCEAYRKLSSTIAAQTAL